MQVSTGIHKLNLDKGFISACPFIEVGQAVFVCHSVKVIFID